MFKVLLSGNDFRLLATRAAVLTKTGASVVIGNVAESIEILDREKIALVVLCHSLQDAEAAMIVEKVRQEDAQTKTLMVVADVSRNGLDAEESFDATVVSDPALLIEQVTELLHPHRVLRNAAVCMSIMCDGGSHG